MFCPEKIFMYVFLLILVCVDVIYIDNDLNRCYGSCYVCSVNVK